MSKLNIVEDDGSEVVEEVEEPEMEYSAEPEVDEVEDTPEEPEADSSEPEADKPKAEKPEADEPKGESEDRPRTQFNVMLDADLKDRMELFRQATGVSLSEQLRRGVDAWLADIGV